MYVYLYLCIYLCFQYLIMSKPIEIVWKFKVHEFSCKNRRFRPKIGDFPRFCTVENNVCMLGCNIQKKNFKVSMYLVLFDTPVVHNGNIWPKSSNLGHLRLAKMGEPKKLSIFSRTFFTFVLRHRKSKSFPAHPSRARKNEY